MSQRKVPQLLIGELDSHVQPLLSYKKMHIRRQAYAINLKNVSEN